VFIEGAQDSTPVAAVRMVGSGSDVFIIGLLQNRDTQACAACGAMRAAHFLISPVGSISVFATSTLGYTVPALEESASAI
jgi:hypothetical protein